MKNRNTNLKRLVTVFGLLIVIMSAGFSPILAKKKRDKEREKSLKLETQDKYLKKWMKQDVKHIITPDEKTAFKQLTSDDERYEFIEQFWLRRDPSPDTLVNETRDEHYRRIAYANERFTSGKPGWKTDRGIIYIMYGPPDTIETNMGGDAPRNQGQGAMYTIGGGSVTHPHIYWRYRHIAGPDLGNEVVIEFVDKTLTGEFRIARDPFEKDALKQTPFYDVDQLAAMGIGPPGTRLASGLLLEDYQAMQNYRNMTLAALSQPPEIRFKDLEHLVETKLSYNLFPFEFRTDFLKITDNTVLTAITIATKNKDMTFEQEAGVHRSSVNVFGRITTITGRRVHTFEEPIRQVVPNSLYKKSMERTSLYQTTVPLRSGVYKIELVLKDLNSNNVGTVYRSIRVPKFPEDQLSTSSIILADKIEGLPIYQASAGPFILGGAKVLPNVTETFHRATPMGIYVQVYNLTLDKNTLKPSATIEYILKKGNQEMRRYKEAADTLAGPTKQITLQKLFPLNNLRPGKYSLVVNVTDNLSAKTVAPVVRFTVQ